MPTVVVVLGKSDALASHLLLTDILPLSEAIFSNLEKLVNDSL